MQFEIKRTWRTTAAVLLAAALTVPVAAAAGPVVAIDTGRIGGATDHGVVSWKGIPFAAPPVGALRWRAPQPPAGWSGVRQAKAYGSDCMQLPFPSDAAPTGTVPSEDCLYLNVWKPARSHGKQPVIVWIYGGGFVNGGSSPATYSGAPLARQGVVVVSFNYRLGRFGFFAHPALTREDADQGLLANYGYMDQLAALKWVRRNIAAFDGDPANVTIMGESAGGMSVHALLTSPLAQGLFARAVILSGGAGAMPGAPASVAQAEQFGIAFAASQHIAADDADALGKLRALAPEQVVDGYNLATMFAPGPHAYVGPGADGKVAVDPASAYAAGRFAQVPVMVGATGDDIGGRTGFMVAGARQVAGMLADRGVPVYAYRFSYVADSVGEPGARHASDVPYFLGTTAIKYGARTTPRDLAVDRTVSAYLVNFAKKGDPNGARLPAWPRYRRATDEILDIAATGMPLAQKDPWGPEIDAAEASRAGAEQAQK
jgi:para-nitrobenzyl esterase